MGGEVYIYLQLHMGFMLCGIHVSECSETVCM